MPGELIASFLWAQLEEAEGITEKRLAIWQYYHDNLKSVELAGLIRRPSVPEDIGHNAHMYYILLPLERDRKQVLDKFHENGISAVFHYVPLHSSPAGKKFGVMNGELENTNILSEKIIRLPLYIGLTIEQQDLIINILSDLQEV